MVPQAFSNIAKPGYRSGPPASVQQKDLVKLEYMARENVSIANFLSTFPKPGNSWRPVIDLSAQKNKFLAIPKFKMETPESIRASLRKGEWVTSIDLTDAYLHVPIRTQSQIYLRFHFQGVTSSPAYLSG